MIEFKILNQDIKELIVTPKFENTNNRSKVTCENNPTLQSEIEQLEKQVGNDDVVDSKSSIEVKDIPEGATFYGSFKTNIKTKSGKSVKVSKCGKFKMKINQPNGVIIEDDNGIQYKTSRKAITLRNYKEDEAKRLLKEKLRELKEKQEQMKQEYEKKQKEIAAKAFDINTLETDEKMFRMVLSGIRNLWLVGPAGCGKSTLTKMMADKLELPYLCISCGIGTSATEFVGYKYPNREATKFSEYYSKPSVILIDEFTALDPAVAQVLNAALANSEIETTTGTVRRHPDCIIVATSNTFGNGADRQYVANNQLDASTIDRFTGGILEVDYSEKYESQYDPEVVSYVRSIRDCIKRNDLRRVASTRMIIAGQSLKYNYFKNWRDMLLIGWTDNEKRILDDYLNLIDKESDVTIEAA